MSKIFPGLKRAPLKYDKTKVDEESLQLYGLVQKAIENLWIKLVILKTRIWKIFKHKSVNLKAKLNNMDQRYLDNKVKIWIVKTED